MYTSHTFITHTLPTTYLNQNQNYTSALSYRTFFLFETKNPGVPERILSKSYEPKSIFTLVYSNPFGFIHIYIEI